MKKIARISISLFLMWIVVTSLQTSALAVPNLQLYIDGATYDQSTETWVYPGYSYDLWTIGADPGYKPKNGVYETIEEVKIAAAVRSGQTGSITITPLFGASTPAELGKSFNSTPIKGDGYPLSPHGIYASDFLSFGIGDFILDQYGIPDFNETYDPENPVPTNVWGKIMVYHVEVTGYDWVHFDLYNHIEGEKHALFAPFSHDADAEDGPSPVPEPATMLLLGTGLVGIAAFGRRRLMAKKGKNLVL